jgi:hypothetical protein
MTIRRTGILGKPWSTGEPLSVPNMARNPGVPPDRGFPLFATTVRDAETE